MSAVCLRYLFCIICMQLAKCVDPGFKVRITLNGLSYANSVAMQALGVAIGKTTIPDQSGSSSGFDYSISNIHVTQFIPPSSDLVIAADQGLTWSASNAYIVIHGDFHYKKWFVSDGGSFDAKVSGVGFNIGINIASDSSGHPTMSSRSCSSSIGNVDFTFHGGMAWLYNLFRGKVGDTIKDALNGQMCSLVTKAINEDGNQKLSQLPVIVTLAQTFLLDYRMVKSPLFVPGYMETYHKGEIFWYTDTSTESPIVPSPMVDTSDTQRMMYLWISDYIFNTIGDVAQKHGVLIYNLTSKDLPPASSGVLNTTCGDFFCIGKLIPAIGQMYPNSVVDLLMNSTVAPTISITSSGLIFNCSGLIVLYARNDQLPGAYLMSINATMTTTANAWIQNELLYAKINDLSLDLKLVNSSVGPINDNFIDFLINQALKTYLIPKLNDLGSKGFPLLVSNEIKFNNSAVILAENTILISTDLTYQQSAHDARRPADDTLRYVPRATTV